MSIKDRVAVIGVGCTRFGEHFEWGADDMLVDAAYDAFQDAGVEPRDIEAIWLGSTRQAAGVSAADPLKLYGKPITRVENYCASGMDAVRNASFAVAAGVYDLALAIGVEKLKDSSARGLGAFARHPLIGYGRTAPSLYALAANRYFHEYGIDKHALARVSIKNHANGRHHPKAHLRMEVTEEQVLNAPIISSPLGLFDCCPTTDGASAVIVTRAELAKNFTDSYVLVKGLGLAVETGDPFLMPGFSYLGWPATVKGAKQAYEQAGIKDPRKEIDFAEVHDCFTITEIMNIEDLGFAEKGKGWKYVEDGKANVDGGGVAINPSGGLKSFGHPIGATGCRMITEVTNQLLSRAEGLQVKDAKLGMAHNLGGAGAVCSVAILGLP
jgi:acetyl-CoA C-acetyltransferase